MVISFLTVLFFFLSFFYSGRQEQCCVCMLHLLLYLKFILPYDICIYFFFVFRGQRLLYSLSRLSPLWTLKWFSLGTKMDDCLCRPSPAAISATQRSEYHLCSIRLCLSYSLFREKLTERSHSCFHLGKCCH